MEQIKAIYIHIPFCQTICSYCDFCKLFYNKKLVNLYLKELEKEIIANYKGEEISTIYIGGGTPTSLSYDELSFLFSIIKKIKLNNDYEFIERLQPDLLLTFAYGQLISTKVLSLSKYQALNLHGSLLPKYRGAAPIQYALKNGE